MSKRGVTNFKNGLKHKPTCARPPGGAKYTNVNPLGNNLIDAVSAVDQGVSGSVAASKPLTKSRRRNLKRWQKRKKAIEKPENRATNEAVKIMTPPEQSRTNEKQALKTQEKNLKENENMKLKKGTDQPKPNIFKGDCGLWVRPRNHALLKPLIFDVCKEDLLFLARDFQNYVCESLGCDQKSIPSYEICKHFSMFSTITNDMKLLDMFKSFLIDRGAGYFSYTLKENLRILLVLKRPREFKKCSHLVVKKALLDLDVAVLVVEDFKAMWKPKYSYRRYLVEVERGENVQKLFKCTTLLGHDNWQWSSLKKPSITQCRNCQRYGHVASNCRMPYRCVKCKEEHAVGQCPRSSFKDDKKKVYCQNCKKNGHPSNYRGCPAYKQHCRALERQRSMARFSSIIKRVICSVHQTLRSSINDLSYDL